MSHTPGPWEVNQHNIEAVGGLCRPRIAIIDDGAGTSPANAALIAAAPDMLEALLGCIRALELASSKTFIVPGTLEAACAALRKARGEA